MKGLELFYIGQNQYGGEEEYGGKVNRARQACSRKGCLQHGPAGGADKTGGGGAQSGESVLHKGVGFIFLQGSGDEEYYKEAGQY